MEIFGFIFWTAIVFWLGFLIRQWLFDDRMYPYRVKCNGECYEDIPFRMAGNERIYVHRALSAHLEDQHR